MKRQSITIQNSICINQPKETVWDYTQDYNNRPTWDSSIISASPLPSTERVIKLKARGNTTMTFAYKLDNRPYKTTLATLEVKSPLIESAGDAWNYEDHGSGTLWSQVSTIIFKRLFLMPIMLPFFKWIFVRQMKSAMNKAREILENDLYNGRTTGHKELK
jgi:hypothetical protein